MKNKKSLVALLFVALIGLIGTSFAYFTSTDTFGNIFKNKVYKMEVEEVFESPDNWIPGTTTNKTVVATNKGDVDAAVRVSYTESWVDANGQPLPLVDNDNNVAAIINFANQTDWTKEGNYYYYKTKIAKNEATSSFIESVTFNPEVDITATSSCTDTATGKLCTTTTSGYAGGTYTLTITVETVQYDQYKNAWGTNLTIS